MAITTDLAHHYKDRNPEKTIQIIEQFFTSHNIEIKNTVNFNSEIGTYSCTYALYWKGNLILSCNGKGMTELYSKASCFAELYERFCANIILLNNNTFIRQDIKQKKKEKYGYNFYPGEKELTNEEYFNNSFIRSLYYNTLRLFKDEDIEIINNILHHNELIGFPYKSLLDDSIIYQDYNTIFWYLGSTGLATGNTIEEALVQGCSELFERIISEQFFYSIQTKYYSVPEKFLQQEVQEFIKKLTKFNYQVKILDLSYNYNMPVCMVVMYNQDSQILYYRMGAAPVFDIAVERCFTELYQGWNVLPNDENVFMAPYEAQYTQEIIRAFNTSLIGNNGEIGFPYFIYNNIIEAEDYNRNIFFSSNEYTNEKLLNKIKEIMEFHNFHFYWLDISLSQDIKAVHIIPKENVLSCRPLKFFKTQNYSPDQMSQAVKMMDNFNNLLIKVKNNKQEYNAEEYFKIFNDIAEQACAIKYDDVYDALDLLTIIFNYSTYTVYNLQDTTNGWYFYNSILDLLGNSLTLSFPKRDIRKRQYENYKLYEKLKQVNYSDKYIRHIFEVFQKEYLDYGKYEEHMNIYLLYVLYIKSFYDLYNSETYNNFIDFLIDFEKDRPIR